MWSLWFWHESLFFAIQLFPEVCMASSQPEHAIRGRGIDPRNQSGTHVILSPQSSQNLIKKAFWNIPLRILNNLEKTNIPSEPERTKKNWLLLGCWFIFFLMNQMEITRLCYVTKWLHFLVPYVSWHFFLFLWPSSSAYLSLFIYPWIW